MNVEIPLNTEITEEHESKLVGLVEKWNQVARCTQPVDRELVEYCIQSLFGRDVPVMWCQSPLSLSLTAAFMRLVCTGETTDQVLLTSDFWTRVREVAGEAVLEDIRLALTRLPHHQGWGAVNAFDRVVAGNEKAKVPQRCDWQYMSPTIHWEVITRSVDFMRDFFYVHRRINSDSVMRIEQQLRVLHPHRDSVRLMGPFEAGQRIDQTITRFVDDLDVKWTASPSVLKERERQAGSGTLKIEFEKDAACTRAADLVRNRPRFRWEDSDIWAGRVSTIALWDCCEELFGLLRGDWAYMKHDFEMLTTLAQGVGTLAPYGGTCLVSERPTTISFDDRWRLHNADAPAVRYLDGWSIYAWHGVQVPQEIITKPEEMTTSMIERERNIDVRRVMIERFGAAQYVLQSGAQEIHRDQFGVLYLKPLPGDDSIVMVKVINKTPEPDGSSREYFLRVPPDMRRAKAAVAWTFGMSEDEFEPQIET
jgi:hypothetical protein